jgi:CheY-like chemotaxis protein
MNPKVLLIDDDIDLVAVNKTALEHAGCEVDVAYDSTQGYARFDAFLPDVTIVDLAMEYFDSGFILCHKLDQHPHGQKTKLIILTSAGHETGYRFSIETSEERKWIKADYYLEKPISPLDLVQFVHDKVLKLHEHAAH